MHDQSRLSCSHMTEFRAFASGLPRLTKARTLLEIQYIQNSLERLAFHAFDDLRGYSLSHRGGSLV